MKKDVIILIFIFGLIFSFGFISAKFELGENKSMVEKFYGSLENVRGWINISFDNQEGSSLFEDSRENSISLIELLKTEKNNKYNYVSNYNFNQPEEEKTLSLNTRENKFIGFKFTGQIEEINSIEFKIESDAGPSCLNQLKIDFFNDGQINFLNNKSRKDKHPCPIYLDYGCFDKATTDTLYYELGEKYYCQKIMLSESPKFKLGAFIEGAEGDKNIFMSLYDDEGKFIKSCEADVSKIVFPNNISCEVDYFVPTKKEYFVCINSTADSTYELRAESSPNKGCGFHGKTPSEEVKKTLPGSYEIFAEGQRFLELKDSKIFEDLVFGNDGKSTIEREVNEYLKKNYKVTGNLIDCSKDCIVPIRFIPNINQKIELKDLKITYDDGGGTLTEKNFYDLSDSILISSDFQKLYLDEGGFSVPNKIGNYNFKLTLGNDNVISDTLTVERVPVIKGLEPIMTFLAYPTKFKVIVEPGLNISKYEWKFKDEVKTTYTNELVHTFKDIGQHDLTITITDLGGKNTSKNFRITVGSPKEIIDIILPKMNGNLERIEKQIETFSSFYKNRLKEILNLNELKNDLGKAQAIYGKEGIDDDDYIKIMGILLDLQIPESINIRISADSFDFYPKEDLVDFDIIEKISRGEGSGNKEKYFENLLLWYQENINAKISFKELNIKYESYDEPLRFFEIEIIKKPTDKNPFFIMKELDKLKFEKEQSEIEESGYIYFALEETKTTISFSTTEEIDVKNLPFFISPEITELTLVEPEIEEDDNFTRGVLFISILFLLILIGFITYIVLQEWYKKKYENYLFKNKNDLYNLVSYIQESKKQGINTEEIASKLKKSGWKSEQVSYILKKYIGKRTGMIEIPLEKVVKIFKRKKAETKPQKNLPPKRFNPNHNFTKNTKKRFRI